MPGRIEIPTGRLGKMAMDEGLGTTVTVNRRR